MSLPAIITRPMRAGDARLMAYTISAYLIGYAPKTRQNRGHDLRAWLVWCEDHGLDPIHDVRREHIQAYATHLLESRSLAVTTVCGVLTSIGGWYRHMVEMEVISVDPSARVKHPPRPRRSSSSALSRSELARLLTLAEADHDPACWALVCLLGLQGLRIGEALDIDIEHLGVVDDWRTASILRRKRSGGDTISLAPSTVAAIARGQGDRSTGPLLLHSRGGRLTPELARRRLHRLVASAGIGRRITPHSLRYTLVTLALDAGCSVRDIQATTGHEDPAMISWYDRSRAGITRNVSHEMDHYIRSAA